MSLLQNKDFKKNFSFVSGLKYRHVLHADTLSFKFVQADTIKISHNILFTILLIIQSKGFVFKQI